MFWNRSNRNSRNIFNSGTADDALGLFYDSQQCDACHQDCCILLNGSEDPVALNGINQDCVMLNGCDDELSEPFFAAVNA